MTTPERRRRTARGAPRPKPAPKGRPKASCATPRPKTSAASPRPKASTVTTRPKAAAATASPKPSPTTRPSDGRRTPRVAAQTPKPPTADAALHKTAPASDQPRAPRDAGPGLAGPPPDTGPDEPEGPLAGFAQTTSRI